MCDPRPCLVEKINQQKFPAFFDVDYKLADFLKDNSDPDSTDFDFGKDGPQAWFNKQRKVAYDSLTKVIEMVTDQPFEVEMSLRTCYKYHIYITGLVVNDETINTIRTQVIKEWVKHPEYEKCPQDIEDIVDKKVYTTGLRMLGSEKTGLDDITKKDENGNLLPTKAEKEKQIHQVIFGNMDEYQTVIESFTVISAILMSNI